MKTNEWHLVMRQFMNQQQGSINQNMALMKVVLPLLVLLTIPILLHISTFPIISQSGLDGVLSNTYHPSLGMGMYCSSLSIEIIRFDSKH